LPPREWRLRVEDIRDAIARIGCYVDGLTFEQFQADQKTIDAVVRNLEIIGEAVRHLTAEIDPLPDSSVSWIDIGGMRNILIHEYFGVDLNIIWETVKHDLPQLNNQLLRMTDSKPVNDQRP
jgi:uncharacterized protein with HEPN domain